MLNKIAQVEQPIGQPLSGGIPSSSGGAPDTLNRVLSIIIGLLTTIAGIYFIFLVATGAIAWMGAGGDKGAVERAREKIINGLIGLAIVVSAIFIIDYVGDLLGLNLIDPGEFIETTGP